MTNTNPTAEPTPRPTTTRKFWRRPKASPEDISDRRIRNWAELLATIVLSLSTLITAWAGYQASSWNGIQTALNMQATAMRIDANQLSVKAQQLLLLDMNLFTSWIDATGNGNTPLADFYRARFRDEFRPAFDAWLAANPLTNERAPDSPFAMPQYHLAAEDEAEAKLEEIERLTQSAAVAGSFGDRYTLMIVILAGALLLAGLAHRFEWAELRIGVVAVAFLVMLYCTIIIIRMPIV